jgi:outer membrane protein OmpA-like peptidoglycan-associated protein
MQLKIYLFFIIFLTISQFNLLEAQSERRQVVGYVFEDNNSGFLNEVKVVAKTDTGSLQYSAYSNMEGKFELWLPLGQKYYLTAIKKVFEEAKDTIDLSDTTKKDPIYLKMPMQRQPGYLLEVSITEFVESQDSSAKGEGVAYSLDGVTIEVYNNTIFQEELRLKEHDKHNFSVLLEQGNEYIFMLRKEGYYTKRMRANVNVNGCILCMEGFGTVTPGVAQSLTRNNTMGTLIGNVTLKKVEVGKTVKINNIYYDYGSASIRKDSKEQLDLLAEMMRDNPRIVIELSSHTDARGSKEVNKKLSQYRAESVVRYIKSRARIKGDRIEAKGYGEERPVNSCVDGIQCSEEMHQQNRRTEFTVIDIKPDDVYMDRSLASIMQEENMLKMVEAHDETAFMETTPMKDSTEQKGPAKPEVIQPEYTGYKVQLMTQLQSPDINHPIFTEFNPVFLDIDMDGKIAFLVGDFKDKNSASSWMKKYIKSYPKATVVYFKEGIRQ